jgi:hypothetical protein
MALVGSGVPRSRLRMPESRRMQRVIARLVNVALMTPKHMIPGM